MGKPKPPAEREGDAHSHRGEVFAALSGHFISFLSVAECRLLVRVVDQLHFRYGTGARKLTLKFIRTGVLPDGTRVLGDIGISDRNTREALYSINAKWPGLITRWQEPDQFGSPVYWWSLNLDMFLACPMPAGGAKTETDNMAIRPVARILPPGMPASDTPGPQHPTPPDASVLPPRMPASPLNTGYKSELEIRTEIHRPASPSDDEIAGFKIGFSLTGNDLPAQPSNPEFSTPTADQLERTARIKGVAGDALAQAAAKRAAKAQKARAKPVSARKLSDIVALWSAAMADNHPNFPTPMLTKAEMTQAKRLVGSWDDSNGELADLIAFSVREWAGIMNSQFAWVKRHPVPVTPDIGFFCVHWKHFAKAFAAGRHYQLPDDKRSELQKLMAEGKSEAQAMQIMRERQEAPKVRQRVRPTPEGASWTNPNWVGPTRKAGS